MSPRGRKRLVVGLLLALAGVGAVLALVLHPGPDLTPQVAAFLKRMESGDTQALARETALMPARDPASLADTSRFLRAAVGRFEGFGRVEPLERVEAERPTRRLVAELRFSRERTPVRSVFTFVRGPDGWLLSDFDIPVTKGAARAADPERLKREAARWAELLAGLRFDEVHMQRTRASREAEDVLAFTARMHPVLDGLGALAEARATAVETREDRPSVTVRVRYDGGAERELVFGLGYEEGRWKPTTIEARVP